MTAIGCIINAPPSAVPRYRLVVTADENLHISRFFHPGDRRKQGDEKSKATLLK